MSLLTLGVETSGLVGAVALRRDGETIAAVTLQQAGRRHAQTLVSEVEALLRKVNLTAKQLQVVAVSIGPGSFTGLRVGVVFAKTLAYAVGCRLIAVDTFRAIAAASSQDVADLFVVSDAQRGEFFVGRYSLAETATGYGMLIRQGEISIESADSFCRRAGGIAVSGPAAATLPTTLRVLAADFRLPRAEFVAELGEQQALAGEQSDLWGLEPVYLRRSAAEEKAAS